MWPGYINTYFLKGKIGGGGRGDEEEEEEEEWFWVSKYCACGI
jgi:hypothetical protein